MIEFNPVYSFAIECADKKIRLVLYKDQAEYVCRKERASTLKKYISSGEGHLFKGRLQLYKHRDRINIIARNEIIGTLSADQMAELCKLNTVV